MLDALSETGSASACGCACARVCHMCSHHTHPFAHGASSSLSIPHSPDTPGQAFLPKGGDLSTQLCKVPDGLWPRVLLCLEWTPGTGVASWRKISAVIPDLRGSPKALTTARVSR